jgi:hypothetical protein
VPSDNRGQKPGFFDPVDRKGTRLITLVVVGVVFVVLALLMLTRGGAPGPEREGARTDASPKVEQPSSPPMQR